MRKGTLIIAVLLVLIGVMAWVILAPDKSATSINSAGIEVPVAENEANIQSARGAQAWDSVRLDTIYYYYVDGRPEAADGLTRTSDMVPMRSVTEFEAIQAVQKSLKKGTYRIIAVRTPKGGTITTCPYIVNGELRDNGFG